MEAGGRLKARQKTANGLTLHLMNERTNEHRPTHECAYQPWKFGEDRTSKFGRICQCLPIISKVTTVKS